MPRAKKIQVNTDLAFVSFANLPLCHYMEDPPLASVEQFPFNQGQKAAEILWQLLDADPDSPVTEFTKVIMESKLMVNVES